MELYLIEQASDIYKMYVEKLDEEVRKGGHVNYNAYLMLLEAMDEDKKKDWEKRLTAEIAELKMIQSDIKALREFLAQKQSEVKR